VVISPAMIFMPAMSGCSARVSRRMMAGTALHLIIFLVRDVCPAALAFWEQGHIRISCTWIEGVQRAGVCPGRARTAVLLSICKRHPSLKCSFLSEICANLVPRIHIRAPAARPLMIRRPPPGRRGPGARAQAEKTFETPCRTHWGGRGRHGLDWALPRTHLWAASRRRPKGPRRANKSIWTSTGRETVRRREARARARNGRGCRQHRGACAPGRCPDSRGTRQRRRPRAGAAASAALAHLARACSPI
jgi:hypothetical protein